MGRKVLKHEGYWHGVKDLVESIYDQLAIITLGRKSLLPALCKMDGEENMRFSILTNHSPMTALIAY